MADEPPGRADAPGRLAVLARGRPARYYSIDRDWILVGRHRGCDLPLDDPGARHLHLTVARLGSEVLAVDHDSDGGTWFLSRRIRQQFQKDGDALRVGDHWLLLRTGSEPVAGAAGPDFCGSIPSSLTEDEAAPGVGADGGPDARVVVWGPWDRVTTDGRPLLIGTDDMCAFRLPGEEARRFQAIVSFREGRLEVEGLEENRALTVAGNEAASGVLTDGAVFAVAGHEFRVEFQGSVAARSRWLAEVRPPGGRLAVTCIVGPSQHATSRLAEEAGDLVIGRAEDCDLRIRGPRVSRAHAAIHTFRSEDGGIRREVRDLGSKNGTWRNGCRIGPGETRRLVPGDVIGLGRGREPAILLVHYSGDNS